MNRGGKMQDFLSFVRDRYSVRSFKNEPVEQEKIDLLLEAANAAPTACNKQPQKIYVIKSEEKRKLLAQLSPCTFDAPLVFVIGYDAGISAKGYLSEDYDFGTIDASITCTHMMLEAHDLGLGSCWVGYFNERQLAAALELPDSIRLCAILPVGYADDNAQPSVLHTKRRDVSEIYTEL